MPLAMRGVACILSQVDWYQAGEEMLHDLMMLSETALQLFSDAAAAGSGGGGAGGGTEMSGAGGPQAEL